MLDQKKLLTWINGLGTLPLMLSTGLQYIGIKEYPTKKNNNPVIMAMAKRVGVDGIYKDDETAWCALFMCYLCLLCGKPMPFVSYQCLRAKSFLLWPDQGFGHVEKFDERLGDIAIFQRPGGFHVAIVIAQTQNGLIIFGANQSNSVGFAEMGRNQLVGTRRYYKSGPPPSAKVYKMESTGDIMTDAA